MTPDERAGIVAALAFAAVMSLLSLVFWRVAGPPPYDHPCYCTCAEQLRWDGGLP